MNLQNILMTLATVALGVSGATALSGLSCKKTDPERSRKLRTISAIFLVLFPVLFMLGNKLA